MFCSPQDHLASISVAKDDIQKEAHPTTGKRNQNMFRSVTQLSMGSENLPGFSVVDMVIFPSISIFVFYKIKCLIYTHIFIILSF